MTQLESICEISPQKELKNVIAHSEPKIKECLELQDDEMEACLNLVPFESPDHKDELKTLILGDRDIFEKIPVDLKTTSMIS